MNLCLDTNIAIELMRRRSPHYRMRIAEAQQSGAGLHLSAISVHELVYGAKISAHPERQRALVEQFTAQLDIIDWSLEDAVEAADIRADLKRRGTPVGGLDVLIAGQARRRGWTVVTANVKDFGRVDGLKLIDWSDPAGPIDVTGAMASLRRPPED